MPNRIIKESIRTSRNVNALSDFLFRIWVYLITYVDDYGRGSADPQLLKGFVLPRREGITEHQITEALRTLASRGMITLYEVEGEPYFCFPKWEEHQQIRAKKSKFPGPEDEDAAPDGGSAQGHGVPPAWDSGGPAQGYGLPPAWDGGGNASDGNGYQMISDDITCARNPIQSKTKPNTNQNQNTNTVYEGDARAGEDTEAGAGCETGADAAENAEKNAELSPAPGADGAGRRGVRGVRNAGESGSDGKGARDMDGDRWEEFWMAYPRKVGGSIDAACREYLKAVESGVEPELMIRKARELGETTPPERMRYIPAAEKWLRNRGWLQGSQGTEARTTNPFLQMYAEEHGL